MSLEERLVKVRQSIVSVKKYAMILFIYNQPFIKRCLKLTSAPLLRIGKIVNDIVVHLLAGYWVCSTE